MKKYIGWSIVAVVIAAIAMGGWVVWDSRAYFKDLFETKRQKLNLRSEQSVDSLVNVITEKTIYIDSLETVLGSTGELSSKKEQIYEQKFKDQQQTITNLRNVIEHQNRMLDELRTKSN